MNLKSIIMLLLLGSLTLFSETGDASWYGKKFQGKPTASGKLFDMYAYTASHKTLPFGTMITVTNLSNHKSIDVEVTDRGTLKKDRIVDLSYQAAKEIGLIELGVTKVEVKIKSKVELTKNLKTNNNPYLTESQEASMKEYAMTTTATKKRVVENEYLPSNVPIYSSKDETIAKRSHGVNVQIGSFSNQVNAENFMNLEKENGYTMKIIDKYVALKKRTLYKVVIVCNSNEEARNIINLKKYKGAYLLY